MGDRSGAYVTGQDQPAAPRTVDARFEPILPGFRAKRHSAVLPLAVQTSVAEELCQADIQTEFEPVTHQQSQTSRLYDEVRELRKHLRASQTRCDELSIQLHNKQPGQIFKRRLHAILDLVQGITPENIRACVRTPYLRIYRRIFPHGSREFGSADLVRRVDGGMPSSDGSGTAGVGRPGTSGTTAAGLTGLESYPSYRPLVSVVLPVWNQAEFLNESVESVLKQSYREIELIVVDDGSSADLTPVLDAFAGDPRVCVIRKDHEGIAQALNTGFRLAKGELLTWTSADNVMRGEALETLADYMLRYPATDMVYANMELMDESAQPLVGSDLRLNNQRLHASHVLELPESVETRELAEDNFIGACFMYRRSAAAVIGDYDDSRLGTEDYDYWLRMHLCGTIRHLDSDACLYRYRVHGESLTAKFGQTVVAENISAMLGEHKERTKYFRRPFAVEILHDGDRSVPSGAVMAIASSLRRDGHRVRVYSASPPDGFDEDLPFVSVLPLDRAWLPEEGEEAEGEASLKRILVSFLDPRPLDAKVPPRPGSPAFRFQWLPPDRNPNRLPAGSGSPWLLCGSADCLDRLTEEEQGRASLLIPSRAIHEDESLLFLKARDNSYPLPELPQLAKPLALYAGSTEKTFLDADVLLGTAERYPKVQFVVIEANGDDSPRSGKHVVRAMNILYLQGKSPLELLAYLSQASVLLAPLRGSSGRLKDVQDLCHLYLLAGKPILATDAVGAAGFRDLPNAIIAPREGFAEKLPAALRIRPNLAIADEYRLTRISHRFRETGFAGARDEFFMALGRHRLSVASP